MAFGAGSQIRANDSWVQPGEVVVVSINCGSTIDDQHGVGSIAGTGLPDLRNIRRVNSWIHQDKDVREYSLISQGGQVLEKVFSICAKPFDLSEGLMVWKVVIGKKDPEPKRRRRDGALV
ncbi:MAG: hypothetical protein HC938_05505 [Nitrospira sp.]|nr:hypothetical protein [Nitrospira sp.]